MNENENLFQTINENEIIEKENNDNIIVNKKIETTKDIKISEETKEAFITGLPEWDLTPPYNIIRRVNR